jgi:hypothetical protein
MVHFNEYIKKYIFMKRKINKKQCKKCGKFFHPGVINKHENSCGKKHRPTFSIDKEWKQQNGMYKCPYCNKLYKKSGIATHIWRQHKEGKKHNPNLGRKVKIWNKGLTKETDDRVRKNAETLSKNMKGKNNHFYGKHHTREAKEKISVRLSRNNKGGRCKWFQVKNPKGDIFNVQGTWERDFSKVLNHLDESWIKIGIGNKNHTYEWIDKNGNKHNYTPDFYSPKLNKYFEVKGYWWGDDKEKMEYVLSQHNLNLEIVRKKELKNYLNLIS